jgi:integrase
MPRLTKSVPNYRKHKPSGLSFVELSGTRIYLGPYGTKTSKQAYDRAIAEWLANGRRLAGHADGLTIVEMCDRYRKFAEKYYVKNGQPTCLHRIKQAMKSLREIYGREPAAKFGPIGLKAVRERMIARDLSRHYINQLIDCIRRAFKWAAAEELIPAAVPQALSMVAGLRRGKTTARETAPVTPVDGSTLAATLPHLSQVVRDMVEVQRLTGMRPAEVCAMRPMDLEHRADGMWVFHLASHKTEHHGRRRTVAIGPRAHRILSGYLERAPSEHCFRPIDAELARRAARHAARTTPVSCGNRPGTNVRLRPKRTPGDRYDVSAYRRAIHRACDKAFPAPADMTADFRTLAAWQREHRWSPNRLRHAAATEIRRKFGLEAAQTILGHANMRTTEFYAERDLAKAMEIARSVG